MEMLPRSRWHTRVSDGLTLMAYLIKARSKIGMNDAAIGLETFVGSLLNELYDWNLVNLNQDGPNAAAADLGDKERREAVQVTIQDSGKKISHTVDVATHNGLAQNYDRITIFFLLPEKPAFPKKLELPTNIKVETLDIADLTRRVGQVSDIAKLERIAKIVEDELGQNIHGYEVDRNEDHPELHARFHETRKGLAFYKDAGNRCYEMSIWVENAPEDTRKVVFDILHETVKDTPWTIKRKANAVREFETKDVALYGDVDIWARGVAKDGGSLWKLKTTLYESLLNHYGDSRNDPDVAEALTKIRDN